MPRRRCRLRLGTGLSLTRQDLAVRAGPGGRVDLGPAARDPVDLGDPAVLGLGRDLVDQGDRVVRGLAVRDPVGLADIRHLAGPVGLLLRDQGMDRVVPVGLADLGQAVRVDQGMDRAAPVGLADIRHLAGPVGRVDQGMNRAAPADLDPVGLADQGMDRAGLADLDRVDPADPVGRVDQGMNRVDPAVRADRHRRLTGRVALSIGVAPRWAAPGMCRTASARPATVRRLRHHNADGAGMAGLRPGRRRLGGTDRRPRVAGAVLRLLVVGTAHGMVRRVTWASGSVISGRSITTGTTRSRCLTRCSVDGASGSSVSGSRCTETP